MKIDLNSRWGKWFLMCLWSSDTRWRYEKTAKNNSLCQFMRVCFLWGPLKFALVAAAIIWCLAFTVYFPIISIGWIGTLMCWVAGTIAFMLICAGIFGIIYLSDYHDKPSGEKTVFGQWIAAKKAKICPIIEFTRD